ncbi:hypothetical protein LXA43DRAFT_1178782 [Ganoderma leucocontextum]|nr:hypothetical protein LXA43DRAFT_1178782 [Ganoderma leucocontextum]
MSNASDTRPVKRARLSEQPQDKDSSPSSSSAVKLKLRRHAEFWFTDGNIILATRRTGFRIYRGPLASQSTVFSDMFASSTSSADETFDGCPVVQLSDSPHDLAHLLHVLLPKVRIHYQATDADPVRTFEEVSALVRLAHKYHIQQVQDQALAALQLFDFTSDFKTFLRCTSSKHKLVNNSAESIGAVNLAHLTDTPYMVPLAMYNCAYLDSAVLNGWKRRDGTVEQLSPADLRRCINGRIALGREQFSVLLQLFEATPSANCGYPDHCQGAHSWTAALRSHASKYDLCESCEEMLVDRNRQERRKVWNKLPEIFDIEVEEWGEPESESESEDGDE